MLCRRESMYHVRFVGGLRRNMLSNFKCVLEKRSSRVQTFYIEESFASFQNHSKVNRYKLTSLVTHCQRSNIRLWRSLDSLEMPCQDVNNFPAWTDVIVRRRRKESHERTQPACKVLERLQILFPSSKQFSNFRLVRRAEKRLSPLFWWSDSRAIAKQFSKRNQNIRLRQRKASDCF